MRMEIKIVKMTGDNSNDTQAIAQVYASLTARGFLPDKISTDQLTEIHYDAYAAGGVEDHRSNITVLIART